MLDIVWLRDNSKYYTLTRELLHLVEWRFRDLGIKFGEEVMERNFKTDK